uniref:Protein HOTHEAD-like n=1 Tax=Cicer arietinum TaxID=3827 RepID=A0A1S3EAE2_CICAR|nr:protein HOTHEAD-like [Cicer arietinum]
MKKLTSKNRIFKDGVVSKTPKVVGVIFKDENGKPMLENDRHSEVILSSREIGTPQMLLLSGIGPKDELHKLNISVVLDNPFVGKGMELCIVDEQLSRSATIRSKFSFLHDINQIGQLSTIPPKQRSLEAVKDYVKNKRDVSDEAFKGGFVLSKVASAWSVGELKLNSTNVDENPSVTFNYLSHPYDLQPWREHRTATLRLTVTEFEKGTMTTLRVKVTDSRGHMFGGDTHGIERNENQ